MITTSKVAAVIKAEIKAETKAGKYSDELAFELGWTESSFAKFLSDVNDMLNGPPVEKKLGRIRVKETLSKFKA